MKGGYFMMEVNADLSKSQTQTITGVYELAKKAVGSGKPIIVHGMNYSGLKSTPICAFGWLRNDSVYILNAGQFLISIERNDGLTVSLNKE